MTGQQVISMCDSYVMNTYGRNQIAIEKGCGAKVYDFEGKEYIDFSSGIGVNSLGYGNQKWVDAVTSQAQKLAHISNLFYTEPCSRLAERLCRKTGMKAVFFANGGGEANEGAIKLARKYSFDKYGADRSTIITLVQSFHGRTVTTLAATGQDKFHNYFFPFTEGFRYAPANNIEALKNEGNDVCAVMVELVQGEGGVLPLDKDYVKELVELCNERDWLLLVDEVQTGVGRTGELFAFQNYGIMPDVVSFAKGIGGGLPLGGIMANEKCAKVLVPGTHATTFGGNPVCCNAALAVLDVLENGVLAEVAAKGEYIKEKLKGLNSEYVADVRGLGLMLGVVIKGAEPKDLVAKMLDEGVLVLTAGSDVVRLLPPLTITYEEIDKGIELMSRVLK